MKKDYFMGKDGRRTAFYTYETENPRIAFQMIHGMAEHIGRYENFAKKLSENGIIFIGSDLRCHGENFDDKLGYAEGDTWNDTISDQLILNELIHKKYGIKTVVCGHSYGSFLTQALIERGIKADMFILSGSCFMSGFEPKFGSFVADRYSAKDKKRVPDMILNFTFESYNKKAGGEAAWLSRDQKEVDKYNADPFCGFKCSANFYSNFFRGLKSLHAKDALNGFDKNIPIRLFAGDSDPVGKNGKGVKKLYDYYRSQGVRDVAMKLYEGGRHEILNEINKDEVTSDIISAINEAIG